MKGLLLSFFCIFSCIFCFSKEDTPKQMISLKNELIKVIVNEYHETIQQISENKLFINPKNIHPSEDGLFLWSSSKPPLRLTSLNSNEQGCYVEVNEITASMLVKCKNPSCGRVFCITFDPASRICPSCRTPY